MSIRLPLRLLASTALFALLTASCGVLDPPAATVDGIEITRQRLDQQLDLAADLDGYRQALEQQLQTSAQGDGTAGTISSGFAAGVLTFDIYYAVVAQEVGRRGIEVTDDHRQAARQQLSQQFGEEVLAQVPDGWRQRLLEREAQLIALRTALGADVGPTGADAAQTYFREHPELFERRCLSVILVASGQEGDAAAEERVGQLRDRLTEGADFAEVARAESDEPQSAAQGGDVGCTVVASVRDPALADVVADLDVGEVSEPVRIDQGWLLVTVTSAEPLPFEQVQSLVQQQLQDLPQAALSAWLAERLAEAEVDVDPRYGSWEVGPGGRLPHIEPPPGPRGA